MFVRDVRRLALFIGPVLVLAYITLSFYGSPTGVVKANSWLKPSVAELDVDGESDLDPSEDQELLPVADSDSQNKPETIPDGLEKVSDDAVEAVPGESADVKGDVPLASHDATDNLSSGPQMSADAETTHQEVFSLSTQDHRFFYIDMGETHVMNPNILPHPTLDGTWIVVAQQVHEGKTDTFAEMVCEAVFQDQILRCQQPPTILPIAATSGGMCEGDLAYFNLNIGPHDARVFFGPEKPYALYGSNSAFTCFGQFVQDFRTLVDWGPDMTGSEDFKTATELQRPPPWGAIEKNWFLFWDADGQAYLHYDIAPKRLFARLEPDGSVGQDLAPFAEESDEKCFAKYMPQLASELESVHQATNSLQITMCKRSDSSCVADDSNTFIFAIYQHKTFYDFHSVYEPYVMLFRPRVPFEIHAISHRPLWIHGRENHPDSGTADMFYVTSMAWKNRDLRYHGYLDDELFLGFGIEDKRAAGIDLLAGHLLEGLGLCAEI